MNVSLKNSPKTINKTKISRPITGLKLIQFKESHSKPTIRRSSDYSYKYKTDSFKRRTFSLEDKANIMTTSIYFTEDEIKNPNLIFSSDKSDIIPEKETSEIGDNISSKEPVTLHTIPSNDSLDNFKSSSFPKANELENDFFSKDKMEDSVETPVKNDFNESSKKSDNNSKLKLNHNKPVSNSSGLLSKDKSEKPLSEKKIHDPKVVIEEMRRYYENEIYVLKKQLQQVGYNIMPNEEALQKRCHLLESQLRKTQNEAESLNEQVNGMKTQLQTWPNRVTELEEDNESLRGRIEDVRAINQQRQNEIDELHEIVKNLETKLWEHSTGNQQQEKIFLQRLMQEYDHLLKDYDLMKLNYMSNERKLYESRTLTNDLSNKVTDLESKVRKVESENHFLKRRLANEKSFVNSNYRGWARSTYPPRLAGFEPEVSPRNGSSQELLSYSQLEPQPQFDMGMMSMSCYGALPSYSSSSETREQISENIRRFEPLKTKMVDRYNQGKMNSSMYVQPTEELNEVITPTSERRRVAIKDDSQYPKKQFKIESASFDMLNEVDDTIGNQQMTSSISDFRQGEIKPSIGRRKKPEYYNRDSWASSRVDEDVELERRYDLLQNEKKQLLTKLSHIPSNSSGRNRRSNREQRESLEAQLDQIDRQLGLMRMTLKQKNILK